MIPCVLGLEADDAEKQLQDLGFGVCRTVYVSKRGVPGADSARVIRQREIGNNSIEIIVSYFKTEISDD